MIPLRDDAPRARTPYVTYALIAVNVAVFLWQYVGRQAPGQTLIYSGGHLAHLSRFDETVWRFGVRPVELTTGITLPPRTPGSDWITPLTSMFMHGGWLHLSGNMLFLWIFGDNVEGALGPARFALFYLGCGAAGVAAQVLCTPGAAAPVIGASGAIAGVMGAYLLLYPRARVLTLIPLFLLFPLVEVPAVFFLLVWIGIQLLAAPAGGGTAWFAHIGGFATGLAVALLLSRAPRIRETARRRRARPSPRTPARDSCTAALARRRP